VDIDGTTSLQVLDLTVTASCSALDHGHSGWRSFLLVRLLLAPFTSAQSQGRCSRSICNLQGLCICVYLQLCRGLHQSAKVLHVVLNLPAQERSTDSRCSAW
jgi:hypothetical protein